jgi:dTDP-4-dehydrorhamnose reductase
MGITAILIIVNEEFVMKTLFIFGGNSRIGCSIKDYYHENFDIRILSSTRRRPTKSDEFHFELEDGSQYPNPQCGDVALICLGLTNIGYCESNKEIAWNINVSSTLGLMGQLYESGVYVCYLSTSSVFEGRTTACSIMTPKTPKSTYARTKAEVEDRICSEYMSNVSILRLPKVTGAGWSILDKWKMEYHTTGLVRPFSNRHVYPVGIEKICSKISILLNERRLGIFHLNGGQKTSFATLCAQNARLLGIDRGKIRPTKDTDWRRGQMQTPNLLPNF